MKDYAIIQKNFIAQLEKVTDDKKLWQELMTLLDQSKTVVYKKLRCHAPFSFSELVLLAKTYGLSIDAAIGQVLAAEEAEPEPKRDFRIELMPLVDSFEALANHLNHTHGQLSVFQSLPHFSMMYVARDIPLFDNYWFEELGALKALVWIHENQMRTVRLKQVPKAITEAGSRMLAMYNTVRSTEIWTGNTLDTTINQIKHCYQRSLLNKFEMELVFDKMEAYIAEKCASVLAAKQQKNSKKEFIISPFIMMTNGTLVNLGQSKMAMVALSGIQSVVVHHHELVEAIEKSFLFQQQFGKNCNALSEDEIRDFFGLLAQKLATEKTVCYKLR